MHKLAMHLALVAVLGGCPEEHAPAPRRDPAERPRTTDASTPTPPHLDDDASLRDPFEPPHDASRR